VDGGHALAQRSRGDGGHVDILAVRNVNETFQDLQFYFGLVQFEKLEFFQQDADFLGNLGDGFDIGSQGNVKIRRYRADKLE
jgi:hypothetical protein